MNKILKKLDYLGTEPKFYVNGQTRYDTNFGGFITVILALMLSILFLLFGRDFYNRTNPTIISETGNYVEYPNYKISNSNFTLVLGLEKDDATVWKNSSQIYVDLRFATYIVENGTGNYNEISLPLVNCEERHFSNNAVSNSERFKQHYCVDFDGLVVGGLWDSDSVKYFFYKVNVCNLGTNAIDGTPCSGELPDLLTNNALYLSIYMQHYSINPTDYNSPLVYGLKNDYFLLDSSLQKKLIYYFGNAVVTSDYGWIFENKESSSTVSFDKLGFDINKLKDSDHTLAIANFYFTKSFLSYSRAYTKIQTLAANVGGVMKLLMMLGFILVKEYNNFYLNIELATILYKQEDLVYTQLVNNNSTSASHIKINNLVEKFQAEAKLSISTHPFPNKIKKPDESFYLMNKQRLEKFGFFTYLGMLVLKPKRDYAYSLYDTLTRQLYKIYDYGNIIKKGNLYEKLFIKLIGSDFFNELKSKI